MKVVLLGMLMLATVLAQTKEQVKESSAGTVNKTMEDQLDHMNEKGSCDLSGEGFYDMFRGFALGIQKDHNNSYADCYLHVDRSVQNWQALNDDLKTQWKLLTTNVEELPANISD